MNQQGFIVEIVDDKTAKMRMQRHSACASCGKCAKLTSESQDLVVEVDNQIGAKVGDHVEVSMESVKVMKATMLAYILPLVFLIAGTAICFFVLNKIEFKGPIELLSGLSGLLFTFLSYLYLRKNDKKYRESRDYIPVVVRII
ncbi:SoxR reducing system RseC family protein [Intestinibacter sp.]|uniref:SoxR reducing system RseC family protein n=1 Tax=Intestinibacter sp. TaxID=1965304 RepID=UPI002A90ADB4|nr:SoxR reducing system RseC family protein [Intestinibacter sp.]MDY5211224.1 SoxR reducing system RseC family protein [Intestinibacter sp.]